MCLIYLLFLLGRLRFLHFQLMLDCTVSNKWNEFSDLILVLRLLSTSLSDCTAWHRPGWVSSLWSWEARPGIAGGFRSGAKRSRKAVSMAGPSSAMHGHTVCRSKWKSLISSGVKTVDKGAGREKLQTAAYQTQQEHISATGREREHGWSPEEKRCSSRFLQYLFFSVLLNL